MVSVEAEVLLTMVGVMVTVVMVTIMLITMVDGEEFTVMTATIINSTLNMGCLLLSGVVGVKTAEVPVEEGVNDLLHT